MPGHPLTIPYNSAPRPYAMDRNDAVRNGMSASVTARMGTGPPRFDRADRNRLMFTSLLASLPLALAAPAAEWVSRRDALVLDASPSQLREWIAGDEWEARLLAMDVAAWQGDRGVAQLAWTAEPTPYRGSLLRFGDSRLPVPAAAGPLLARMVWGQEPAPVRLALAEALAHTGSGWASAVAALLPHEPDPAVRKVLVEDARAATPTEAAELVRVGFADKVPTVRAAAARTAPWVAPVSAVAPLVLAALADAEPGVRCEAARSVGMMDLTEAWPRLVALLSDADARVRLQALRSLQRLDSVHAASLPQLEALRNDSDGRVQRAAMGAAGD